VSDDPDIRETLKHFAENIDRWRAQTAQLRADTDGKQGVTTEVLVHIEDTSGDIYREIEAFNLAVTRVAEQSPKAAGELAGVGEALHLLLLDLTELGTGLYSRTIPTP